MEVCLVALMTWSTTSPLPSISIVADVVPVPAFIWHTECYLAIFQTVALLVKLHSWIPSLNIEKL